ncbi:helix-turn-helix domain-containing protein [Paenibacillus sp. LMG 31459]|uniref:Helix-turn-helix domain-containing protein n=1 Tax=Paenibacillus phytohabitans TaxID=2654978 RepID=A0ABX1YD57_9BACL|nr:helix-turn-helix domain-containing protein [Paenibacillus phytohabitans]
MSAKNKMDLKNIGENIRIIRKSKRISQKKLCQGICSQAQLSKIENGELEPQASMLYFLADRLGVNINHLFSLGQTDRFDYVTDLYELIEEYTNNHEYQNLYDLIRSEKNNPLFQNSKYQRYLSWHEGICIYYLDHNFEHALSYIQNSINQEFMTEQDIQMLNSIGVLYCEEYRLEEALAYFENGLQYYYKLPVQSNHKILVRILYNYAVTLTRLQLFEKSIKECHTAVNVCLKHYSTFSLGELFYHIGYNYSLINEITKAKSYYEKSISLFEITDNPIFAQHAINKISELNSDIHTNKSKVN